MQILMLILVAVVLLPADPASVDPGPAAAFTIGGTIVLLGSAVLSSAWLQRGLRGPAARSRIRSAGRVLRGLQWLATGLVAVGVFGFGLREVVQGVIGDPPLVDELFTIAPALVVITATWWIFHPFEKHVQEAVILRQLDEGGPVQPPSERTGWVWMQVRTQMLILLVPIGMVVLVGECIGLMLAGRPEDPAWLRPLLSGLAIVPVLVFAPAIVVRILGAHPLPKGEVRTTLEGMCRKAGVGVRELLLWPTGGAMVNAAVTGITGRLRWVMLTDGLLETLRREQVMAVMAHELAHARRHHMPWMALSVLALASGLALLCDPLVLGIIDWRIGMGGSPVDVQRDLGVIELLTTGSILAATLVGFGWVSRRFERQADAHAACVLSMELEETPGQVVTVAGIAAMGSALIRVSGSSGVPSRRFSWRHGSIASRVTHLRSLVDVAIEDLPIDRTVRRINLASLLLVTAVAGWLMLEFVGEVAS